RGKGMFPEGSERRLTNDDVYNLSPGELKIMRNEIFARHGFIFKTNDMKKHFSTQPWYKPLCDNVTNMLSKIEQDNVNFIRLYE
ncbi:MAG: YARHG domain-containing protein, partial [Flavobacteriia bacterium]|nr:YARHG domain-containing protein [Flavobacteriia bacterium]